MNIPGWTPYELGLSTDSDVTWERYSAFTSAARKAEDLNRICMAENQAEDVILGRWEYSEASEPAQRIVDRYNARSRAELEASVLSQALPVVEAAAVSFEDPEPEPGT